MFDRRGFLASVGAAALTSAAPLRALAQSGPDAGLTALFDRFFEEDLLDSPQRATSLGLDKGVHADLKRRLDGRSAADRAHDLQLAKSQLKALRGVERMALSEPARVDYDVVSYQLETSIHGTESYAFGNSGGRYSPYVISQLNGAYQDIPDFLDNQHRVDTAQDADAYLERLKAFAVIMDQDLDRSRADAAAGVVPPDFVLDLAIAQLQSLRNAPAGQTVLVQSLARKAKAAGLPTDYAAPAEAIVAQQVFPALDRQLEWVKSLRGKAGHDAGVWRLPEGDAYYADALAAATTTRLSPKEVHELGLAQVAEISKSIDEILKAQGMTSGSVSARLTALNDDPKQLYANTDEGRAALIDQLNRQVEAVYALLPQAFHELPQAKVTIKRVPPFIQDGAPNGYYQRAALDGSRPAIYFINLKDTHDWPRFSLPTLTYHEAVPGHHLQISLQQQSTSIPLIRRVSGFSAYSEGWALYAEQLADELGVYKDDPFGHAGFLQSFLFRATRLVVDTGMHYKRWSREQAIDFMVGSTGYAPGRVAREIDRYCAWPGQACSYKVGHTVWMRLRDDAKKRLGARFDIKDFHDVLGLGGMPLTVLENVVRARTSARAA